MQNIIQLNYIPVLLNKLYIPIVKNGKPSIVKTKEAKKFCEYVYMETLRHKTKMIKGRVSFKMDVLIKDRNEYDIDAVLKLLFDSLEGIAYVNDKNIIELIVRKHINAEKDGLVIQIKQLSQD